jgi:hypothetical protein
LANEERKKIWPELKDRDPDILLSIGTAFDPNPPPMDAPVPEPGWFIGKFFNNLLNLLTSLVVNNTNSQRSWYNFLGKLAIKNDDEDRKRKFVRLNPPIGKGNLVSGNCPLPNFDEVDKMAALASYTNELYIPHNSEQLRAVADSLVASLFYFEEDHHVSQKNGDWLVEGVFERPLHLSTASDICPVGYIHCRLRPDSPGRKKLASRLYEQQKNGSKPIFFLQCQGNTVALSKPSHRDVYHRSSKSMAESEPFQLDVSFYVRERGKEIKIHLSLATGNFLLSGFPRMSDEFLP